MCSHANSHFDDEDNNNDDDVFAAKNEQFVKDQELARQLARAPPSPARPIQHHTMDDEKISCLISLQTRSSFYHVNSPGGLIALLRNGFLSDSDKNPTTVLLSGYVDHFQSLPSEDVGWGCGWRNIQMLSSHLLFRRQDAREALFGGSGFVPDIPFLQRWLEIAWEKGFDAAGSQHFNHSVYGSAHRIGTTECAALFRSFGLRARIVDFGPMELKSYFLSVPGSSLGSDVMTTNDMPKRKAFQVYGPMDRYLLSQNHCVSQPDFIANDKSHSSTSYAANGSDPPMENKLPGKNDGHQALFDWVWNYFLDGNSILSPQYRRIVITERA